MNNRGKRVDRRTSVWMFLVGGIAAGLALPLSLGAQSRPAGSMELMRGWWPDALRSRMTPQGAVRVSTVWKKPGWTPAGEKPIHVCWERLPDSTPEQRALVRDAVAGTWASYGMVSFVGWDACNAGDRGIRIGIVRSNSHTMHLGSGLDGVPDGMQLQMDFSGADECEHRNDFCVRATAVHEFGHALALTHEQNRPDAPAWCRSEFAETEWWAIPDSNITTYDPQSIMNYCNAHWNNEGLLSARDIETVGVLYGARR
ncbi:MAG: hypothetical protein GAK28_03748 [Luteibacter sp.]|uniref:hypothetical protein n=1 Tax=Luteibacter sp. TaxID=1886636 RepID=UPI00137F9AF0|nr:hypothetical protein [Luteibacter sp.]KAF1004735.1 MAG: hypothetical protein GAK28_03748 [Luteibacter sp.]